jgi:hypothetical protein
MVFDLSFCLIFLCKIDAITSISNFCVCFNNFYETFLLYALTLSFIYELKLLIFVLFTEL